MGIENLDTLRVGVDMSRVCNDHLALSVCILGGYRILHLLATYVCHVMLCIYFSAVDFALEELVCIVNITSANMVSGLDLLIVGLPPHGQKSNYNLP